MKKILKKPLFWIASIIGVAIIVIIGLGVSGFKIAYNQDLDNNWDAVSACAAWAGVLVSGGALSATLAVLYQNHKTIELSKKDIQNAINLQMFDKMMEIANKLESDDYSSTTMELITLFGQEVLQQVQELRQLIQLQKSIESDQKAYYELLKEEEDYDWQLENIFQQDSVSDEVLKKAREQDEHYRILGELDATGNMIYYDIEKINNELSNLSSDILCKQKHLKNDIYKILREKFQTD